MATQYHGFDVLELPPDGGDGQDDEQERGLYRIDPETGKRATDDPEAQSGGVLTYAWVCVSRAEIAELKRFLDGRRGRAIPFWLPTFRHNCTLNGDHNSGHNFIDVRAFGYTAHMFPDGGARRHLFFRHRTGTPIFYRKVTNAVNNQNGTESLYLDATLGQAVTVSDWMVGFLRLYRLEDDLTRIDHQKGGGAARATLRIREVPKEAPL